MPETPEGHRHICGCRECIELLTPCQAVVLENCYCPTPDVSYIVCNGCALESGFSDDFDDEDDYDEDDHDRSGPGGEWESYSMDDMETALADGLQWRTREGPRRRKEE